MKMDKGDSISNHLLKLKDIHDQFLALGREVGEEDMVDVALKSLPQSFEHFVETIHL
jgi:hypothetical protein